MALPLPYAPGIDADAERLRMAAAPQPKIDVAAGLQTAISGAMSLQEALDARDQKAAAAAFQREYIDKGVEGLQKAAQEAGITDFNVEIYNTGKPEDILTGFKDLTGYREKAKELKAAGELADVLAAEEDADPVLVAGVRSGSVPGKDVIVQRETTKRTEMNVAGRTKAAELKREFDKTQNELDRQIDRLRIAKGGAGGNPNLLASFEKNKTDLADIGRQISEMEAAGVYKKSDLQKLSSLRTQYREIDRQLRADFKKIPPDAVGGSGGTGGSGGSGDGAPPPARPRATNPKTGEIVEWDGKQWLPVKK